MNAQAKQVTPGTWWRERDSNQISVVARVERSYRVTYVTFSTTNKEGTFMTSLTKFLLTHRKMNP